MRFKTGMYFVQAFAVLSVIANCDGGGGSGDRGGFAESGAPPDSTVPTAEVPSAGEEQVSSVASISGASVTAELIFTSTGGNPNCTEFSVVLQDAAGQPVAGVSVTYEAQYSGQAPANAGSFSAGQTASDSAGKAVVSFCAGQDEFEAVLVAKVGDLSQNSGTVTAQRKGAYELKFAGSSLAGMLEGDDEAKSINLNFFNAGPNDCIFTYFTLTRNKTPVSGKDIVFKTPFDIPVGVKLAERKLDRVLETDANTGKKRATFTAKSSLEGLLSVPVCAGTSLGSFNVIGDFKDEDGNTIIGESPTISVVGGLPSYANFSLTFDVENARTLQGFFNTNSSYVLEASVRVESRSDGDAITSSPISISTEIGKLTLTDQGKIVDGRSNFSLQALHMGNNYPYLVFPFANEPDARSRCDPDKIADSLSVGDEFSYYDLSKNWRSTLVYQTQGQEHYYDRNGDGSYEGDGDGFWDKNQNGVYDDGIDYVSYDPDGDGFDYDGEWFIDQPSPFIDVDENLEYDPAVDILLADSYVPPNGKRDSDNVIWKSEVFPIYMGMSFYGLYREKIVENVDADPDQYVSGDSLGAVFGENLFYGIGPDDFYPPSPPPDLSASAKVRRHFFAHGLCGNLLPGGTSLELDLELRSGAAYGQRTPITRFRADPAEEKLDGARTLLSGVGTASAEINFNAVDHPNANRGYPVPVEVEVPPCLAECTGYTATPGVACDAGTYRVSVGISEPDSFGNKNFKKTIGFNIRYPEARTCTCALNASLKEGDCQCIDGYAFDDSLGRCALPPPP